ncbi:MAG: hypothetical protein K5851_06980 [Lachnospiraceae bacterium]|nr:hypothetical protein [Lachnospiraceae bacterium]
MRAAYNEMMGWFHNGFDGNAYFILYLICLVYLFITDEDKRFKLVVPSFLLTVFLINPICYRYIWAKTIGYSYWRLFWVLPIIPVVAVTFVNIISLGKNSWQKYALVLLLSFFALRSGCYLYKYPETAFVKANNAYKLPQPAVDIADYLVDKKDRPRVIADISLARYLRQIHPEIEQGFGRWGQGCNNYVSGAYFFNIFREGPIRTDLGEDVKFDWNLAHNYMLEEKFDYLILPTSDDVAKNNGDKILLDAGFKYITNIDGYGIYSVAN